MINESNSNSSDLASPSLDTQEIVTMDGYFHLSKVFYDHNPKTSTVRTTCSCSDCELFRRITIDDAVVFLVNQSAFMFYMAGGTVEELLDNML